MPRTSPYSITLAEPERAELEARARRYTSAYSEVVRAKIVLYAADGLGNDEIAARYAMAASTVDLNDLRRTAGGDQDPLWDYKVSSWLIAAGACGVQAIVLVILIAIRLRRLDPQRKARK